MANARIPPARAIAIHASGAPLSPSRLNGVVNSTGSGFHDGPVVVTRSPCRISRPQMIHAHGSYVGADTVSSDTAPTARQPMISRVIDPGRRTGTRHARAGALAGRGRSETACALTATTAPR